MERSVQEEWPFDLMWSNRHLSVSAANNAHDFSYKQVKVNI